MNRYKIIFGLANLIFVSFAIFWAVIFLNDLQGETDTAEIFSATYAAMALYGGLIGLATARYWGWHKSLIGRSVLFLSLGLLAQVFGQLAYSAYTYLWHQEIPYPSLGDIGFFGSVIFYLLATYSLIRALSVKSALKSRLNQGWILVLPAVLLTVSYFTFLNGHEYDTSNPLSVFLDFAYPLGQALFISLALLAFILSQRYLGGIMKPAILAVIAALILQYAADFIFLYQVSRDEWQTAGINELMYLVAYYVMTLSLIRFGTVVNNLRKVGVGKK